MKGNGDSSKDCGTVPRSDYRNLEKFKQAQPSAEFSIADPVEEGLPEGSGDSECHTIA